MKIDLSNPPYAVKLKELGMECIIDFEDENCMKPFSFTFKNLYNGISKTVQASNISLVEEIIQ